MCYTGGGVLYRALYVREGFVLYRRLSVTWMYVYFIEGLNAIQRVVCYSEGYKIQTVHCTAIISLSAIKYISLLFTVYISGLYKCEVVLC